MQAITSTRAWCVCQLMAAMRRSSLLLLLVLLNLIPCVKSYNRFWINYKTSLAEDVQEYLQCLAQCGTYWGQVNNDNELLKEDAMLHQLGFDPAKIDSGQDHPFIAAFDRKEGMKWILPSEAQTPPGLVHIPTMCQRYRGDGLWDENQLQSQHSPGFRLHNDCKHTHPPGSHPPLPVRAQLTLAAFFRRLLVFHDELHAENGGKRSAVL